ncbi:hypothetical protein DSO57_1002013 [Entomophthora muscae]|uniref:Uncharacterized protein n=1 Tax=Entomophthora muscae TaxID=34485 RepID=A0ACC2RNV7_9FUNG|nr:hypothetical protein DSO57_1002013 [Entomophthora muscae]
MMHMFQTNAGLNSFDEESNFSPQKLPHTDQDRWGPTSLPFVTNDFSILVSKTQESTPGPQKMPGANQGGQGPINLLSHRLELIN